jgi:hypothetical protein
LGAAAMAAGEDSSKVLSTTPTTAKKAGRMKAILMNIRKH